MSPFIRGLLVLAAGVFSNYVLATPEEEFMQAFDKKEPQTANHIYHANEKDFNPDFRRASGDDAGATPLFYAAGNFQWDLVRRMLELHPKANVDASPVDGPHRGKTALWLAAVDKQWDIVRRMLDLNPNADVNASPQEGPRRGTTPLIWTAGRKQWDLVRRMLELSPTANVNAAAAEGDLLGATPLLLVAYYKQWELVAFMLARHPEANLESILQLVPAKGITVLRFMKLAPDALQKFGIIHLMNQDKEGSSLRERLESTGWNRPILETDLQEIFRRATVAFTNLVPPNVSGVYESSILDPFSKDLKWRLALTTLRQEDRDLKQIPDYILKQLLIRFMAVYKKVDYDLRAIELVAAKVLDVLAPVDERRTRSSSKIATMRKWIIDEIEDAIQRGSLPGTPGPQVRDGLTHAFTAKATTLRDITRKWIRDTITAWAQRTMVDEENNPGRKRERGDE